MNQTLTKKRFFTVSYSYVNRFSDRLNNGQTVKAETVIEAEKIVTNQLSDKLKRFGWKCFQIKNTKAI